jgi:hypothetical protein
VEAGLEHDCGWSLEDTRRDLESVSVSLRLMVEPAGAICVCLCLHLADMVVHRLVVTHSYLVIVFVCCFVVVDILYQIVKQLSRI